ncbi:MAG: DNA mismatch repair endonuclease MutL [Anaerolineae bacterium]
MPIRVLPDEVVAKIAAGEVVERPVSVVKELVENAIDAGASDITVEIREGGRRLVRVIDDGAGILADEVELAFARHATSKLETADDLVRIRTLGFRGEALSSIAAVSQVRLATRAAGEEVGTLVRVEEGRVVHREGRGMAQGTVVTVENLFHNVPARRKFLRSVATEAGHISNFVARYAMAYPEKRFSLLREGRRTFQTQGSGDLYEVLIKVYGLEVAKHLLRIDHAAEVQSAGPEGTREIELGGVEAGPIVSGYISPPSLHRASRKYVTFLVNRRWIQDRMLSYALNEAYHTLLPTGRHPLAVLDIRLDPSEVDVNVHPTKGEVRFLHADRVFAAVQKGVRRTLLHQAAVPPIARPWLESKAGEERRRRLFTAGQGRPSRGELALEAQRTAADLAPSQFQLPTARLPVLRVLGQLAQAYIIAEGPEGMYLIDQHAAHERVLYERFQAQRAGMKVASQTLLEPLPLEFTPQQATVLVEQLGALAELGFDIEPFGGQTYLLRAVPEPLKELDLQRALAEIIDDLIEGGMPLEEETRLITSVCKQAAVKAGQTLSPEEMRELVRELEQTTLPHTCPHGRPTMVHLSQAQLEREFGRR